MSVSVVVLTMRSQRTVQECLDSLQSQTVEPREVIVVAAAELPSWNSDNLKVISDPGGLLAHSRNVGFKASNADVVAFLDSDCAAPPQWIERIEENHEAGIKAMGGPYVAAQKTEYALTANRTISKVFGSMSASFESAKGPCRYAKSVSGGNSAFDSELFLRVGGYDERQSCREEPELGRKIRDTGTRILFDPLLWVYHYWKGFNGLIPLARTGFFYGNVRIRSKRELEH